jgi:hypothetical protein
LLKRHIDKKKERRKERKKVWFLRAFSYSSTFSRGSQNDVLNTNNEKGKRHYVKMSLSFFFIFLEREGKKFSSNLLLTHGTNIG